jgi:sec-independent protein translocase protein TatB
VFGLSFTEVVIVGILALILLGPDQLPNAARTAGKWMRELRRATEDLKDQIETEINFDERKPRPSLVPPVPAQAPVPPAPPPVATAENVPGLEAALAEPGDAKAPEPPAVAALAAPDRPETP